MLKSLVYTLFLSLYSLTSLAQFPMPEVLKLAYTDIYRLKFESAEEVLDAYEAQNPRQLTTAYLRFNILFLQHFVDEDLDAFLDNRREMESLIDQVEDGNTNSPEYYLYVGEMKFQMAALLVKFKRNLSGGQYALGGHSAISDGIEKFPNYGLYKLPSGVLNVSIGSLPDTYRFFAELFGFNGNVELGLDQMKSGLDVSSRAEYSYLREKYVFLYTFVKAELDPDEIGSVKEFGVDPVNSPLLAFQEAKLLSKAKKNTELIDMLTSAIHEPGTHEFPYLKFLLGRAKLARGDSDSNLYLLSYLQSNKGDNYVKSTLRYLSWYYRLKGETSRSEMYRNRVLKEGKSSVGSDLEALRECESPLLPIELIQSRLAFDHGDLEKALSILVSKEASLCSNDLNSLNFHYRLGRIYQQMGRNNEAISAFAKALVYTPSPMVYERVGAQLELAVMYEEVDPSLAIRHYEKVLTFSNYPWYDGTQQKAKAALQRLKK